MNNQHDRNVKLYKKPRCFKTARPWAVNHFSEEPSRKSIHRPTSDSSFKLINLHLSNIGNLINNL